MSDLSFDDEEDRRCAREIREFVTAQLARNMADLRRQMIAEGVPPAIIEATVRYSEGLQLAQLERDLPLMLRDMKITNGETMLQ